MICPVCIANAALTAGGAVSGGGFAAMAFKIFRARRIVNIDRWKNRAERRNEHDYSGEQERVMENRVA